jgi:LysR family nitrogen assimilation transcriptional regulator
MPHGIAVQETPLELRQLRYFKVVADARSFARGAEHLRVAQPALSRSVAKLEEEIGQDLFVRHSAGVSLTDAGIRFYQHATEVLGRVRDMIEGMAAADGVPRGTIALGAPQSMQSKLVLPVAAQFLTMFPMCRVDLIQNSSARLREQVADGSLDLALLPNTVESGMHFTPLLREGICLICRQEARASFGDSVTLGDLLPLPLIITGYPDTLRLHIDRKFPHQSDELNVRSEVNSSAMLVDLVIRGVGFGIAPCSVIAQRPEHQLAFVPIEGLDVAWAIATNWHRRGLRAVQELEAQLVRTVREMVERDEWPTAHLEA